MPTSARRPTIVLVSADGSLEGIDVRLARSGARLVRARAVVPQPVPVGRWLGRLLRGPGPDTVIVTSRAAVSAGVAPWRSSAAPRAAQIEYWAAGPTSAKALRAEGVRRVRQADELGARPIARGIGRHPPRRILYFRSDLAGPTLARSLRSHGHRVTEVVAYRVARGPPASRRDREAISRARLAVVTSPSGVDWLRRELSRPGRSGGTRSVRVVVLGERTLRAARAAGFDHVSLAPSPHPERFTRHLLRELSHGPR